MAEGWSRLARNPAGLTGAVILSFLLLVIVAGPALAPYDPTTFHLTRRLEGPSLDFLLGTDQFGRDLLSRILTGARPAVLFGVGATALAVLGGGVAGMASGYVGGLIDEVAMRALDVVLAVPGLLFALLIVTVLGSGSANAMLAVAVSFLPGFARLARAGTLSIRERDFVAAAIARGEAHGYILRREILPNLMPPIVVEASVRVAHALMIGATLSYLGLGAQAPDSDWGLLVAEARDYLFRNGWLLACPALAIGISALGFNLLGDGLRDLLNPELDA
ncbi:MAG: ABC transporter permease [Rhodobacteraceae bacterium]|nr:ABC transporter permease [Paracoccaceae bacterium]